MMMCGEDCINCISSEILPSSQIGDDIIFLRDKWVVHGTRLKGRGLGMRSCGDMLVFYMLVDFGLRVQLYY